MLFPVSRIFSASVLFGSYLNSGKATDSLSKRSADLPATPLSPSSPNRPPAASKEDQVLRASVNVQVISSDGTITSTGDHIIESGQQVLHGNGQKVFRDGQVIERGWYQFGSPHLVITYFKDADAYQVGPRRGQYLDGISCVMVQPGMVKIGTFVKNELVDGYANGKRVLNGQITDFNPYDPVTLLPAEYYETLLTDSRIVNGNCCTGLFTGQGFTYGRMESTEGSETIVSEGFFNQEGKLDGIGARFFWDLSEIGWFQNGIFISGKINYDDGLIEIGPRFNTFLHGPNCTRIDGPSETISEGTFVEGDHINGSYTIKNGLRLTFPDLEVASVKELEIGFNPYQFSMVDPPSSVTDLPTKEIPTDDGTTYNGHYFGDVMIFGVKTEPHVTSIGYFNVDSEMYGIGNRTFIDGIIERGLYIGNRLMNDKSEMRYEGAIIKGRLINGTQTYQNGLRYPVQFGGVHRYQIDSPTLHRYFINDIEVAKGEPLGDSRCIEIFKREQTPFLLDRDKAQRLTQLFSTSDQIGNMVFDRLATSISHTAVIPVEQIGRVLNTTVLNVRFDQRISGYLAKGDCRTEYPSLSDGDTREISLVVSRQLIAEFGIEPCRAFCLRNFNRLLSQSKSVLTGIRTFYRHDEMLSPGDNSKWTPLFLSYLEHANGLEPYLPSFEIVPTIKYGQKDGRLEFYGSIHTAAADQYGGLFNALFPDQNRSVRYMLNEDFFPFNGLGFRISSTAITHYDADREPEYLTPTTFYRISADVKEQIADWHECATIAYANGEKIADAVEGAAYKVPCRRCRGLGARRNVTFLKFFFSRNR